jgi:carbonic anhydrase
MLKANSLAIVALLVAIGASTFGCERTPKATGAAHAGGTAAHWSYEGATGPAHWGSLSPDYALCSTGRRQSPIDIKERTPRDLPNISFNYQATPIEIVNNGHTVQVNCAPGSFIEADGQRFNLAQFHFHSPSEHHLNGRGAAAEMHLVHKSASGGLAVVAVMIEEGAHNPNFDPVWNNLPARAGPAVRLSATIDAAKLLPADPRTYRYDGSLTTPPGTEGVKWCIMIRPVTLSSGQLATFRSIFNGNNRPTQPLNGRIVVEDSSK